MATTTSADRPPAASHSLAPRLPPGPKLPRWLQTLGFILGGPRYLDFCRRRYGNAVTMSTLFDQGFVMVFDPELVKQVFRGSSDQLHAGEANALLGPIVGERSVLLLDGEQHLRHRRLLLPPFHGPRMRVYEDVVRRATDAEIGAWPIGEPFALLPSMQSLTLHVILQAVFGYEPGPTEQELARRIRAFIEPLSRPRNLMRMALAIGRRSAQADGFQRRRQAVDEILLAEIERRRQLPERELAQSQDVFSALLLAEDESGQRLTDGEVRDELMTLLLAGHETTATGLAWAFDLLLHHPKVLNEARKRDSAYLDAVGKESLRLRPVIPGVGRVVRNEAFALGQWVIPPGHEINPSIRMIHARSDLYPQPRSFRPERFIAEDPPDTYTWLPFGGGTRRCLGASFALMEMRVVLSRVLERTELRPASPETDKPELRVITLSPSRGVQVIQDRPPQP
ncbi:MAG TPA: cytochrome P450 [Solirubrobacteraceae bacterium]|nr:cytochrome P450 [Solirubrobacteraceae bacterium]